MAFLLHHPAICLNDEEGEDHHDVDQCPFDNWTASLITLHRLGGNNRREEVLMNMFVRSVEDFDYLFCVENNEFIRDNCKTKATSAERLDHLLSSSLLPQHLLSASAAAAAPPHPLRVGVLIIQCDIIFLCTRSDQLPWQIYSRASVFQTGDGRR